MNKKTVNALLSRGVSSQKAETLSKKGYTISSLKQKTEKDLTSLGLSLEQAESLLKENRPPIPEETLLKVLYKSRRTCCICRNPNKPIVVHHIDEWAKSRSHDEENLIVLCLDHHDLAHTKKELSQGLSRKELKSSKQKWEEHVEHLDAKAILKLKNSRDYSRWDWINLQRTFELVLKKSISPSDKRLSTYMLENGFIDKHGVLKPQDKWPASNENGYWFLDFGEGIYVSAYLSDIIEQILLETPVTDITPLIKSKKELRSVVSEGDYIVAQLPFYFSDIDKFENGEKQLRNSYYRGHGIRISYVFDAWHCLSSSARFDAMTGRKVKTIFALVRSIVEEDGELQISISCLAAGTAFEVHEARR
ncbi:MAG: HNH endonuclease signature motif containing protein [Alphaproteobacteria bacterium]